jgi:hypothetical protein
VRLISNHCLSALALYLLGLLISPALHAENTAAIVDLKYLKTTHLVAATLCLGEGEDDCVEYAKHYLWQAKVKRIVSGKETRKRFLVLYGRHGLLKKNLRNVAVVLSATDAEMKAAYPLASYQITAFGAETSLICFDPADLDPKNKSVAPIKLGYSAGHVSACYPSSSEAER